MVSGSDEFHTLVSGLDYPMFLVTALSAGGERSGCLVGFATQASIAPPRLVVLLSKLNHTFTVVQRSDALVVHFLRRDNEDLAALFGGQTGDEVDKFARCAWDPGPFGVPVLSGTRGWAAGSILSRWDAGDHVAHLLEISEANVGRPGPPMTFQQIRDLDPGHPA